MDNTVSVLILYYEKLDLTIQCLKSVVKANVPVYVLNNASSAQGWEKLKRVFGKYTHVKFIASETNLGPAGGRNRLIRESREKWLVFLDNDIYIKTRNWLSILQQHIRNVNDADAFIPRLYNVHEKSYAHFHKYSVSNRSIEGVPLNGEIYTNYFPGGASIVNRKVFERLGYYDEKLYVLEDLEFPIRGLIKNRPVKASLINDIELVHNHKYTRRHEDKRAVIERYSHDRNAFAQQYICDKHSVIFNAHWEEWVNKQVYLITRYNWLRKTKRKMFDLFYLIKK